MLVPRPTSDDEVRMSRFPMALRVHRCTCAGKTLKYCHFMPLFRPLVRVCVCQIMIGKSFQNKEIGRSSRSAWPSKIELA